MRATAPQFPEISGYTITEQLYLGSRTAVYRAVHNNQQFAVVIKVLQREYPRFGELVQFRNQYAIAKNLPIAGIIQPLSLETFGNGYALVMPDWGGISLDKYIQQQQLDLTQKLAIAIQLAEILHDLHSSRVIHKDIKPANILIHPQSKQVKLIDFSIASLLPKETQEIQNPNVLEGTLAYLAPEQTGRMNRGIDYRSDFYNFGVTLYQLLTGRLPFITDDPLELVHCHIAKIATPVHKVNTDVPKIMGAIVAKLMAKNAEERYQSALGLKHDLQQCLSQWKETGKIAEFELAQRDLCDRFLIPEKLYGREAEVAQLLEGFERVATQENNSELILVAGFSGIGKTAVVNEVHKPIVRQRGYFIKGKFDQFNRNIPFSALVQALRDLMGQLLSESDAQLQQWQEKIGNAVGENGQVIIEVIPELEKIIGKQPMVPELSGTAAQNRFNLLFNKFIQVFTTKEHPLVIFLDDLQWADSASLSLIKLLMSEGERGYLLLIGAYRDNEVFPAHPLMLTLDEIGKAEGKINTITLSPLSQGNINNLVADTLSCTSEVAESLTELVYQKTKGNPFFTTQFLLGLYGDELIKFNWQLGHWECDISEVKQRALTDDVVAFMAQRLQKLPQETQDILKLAACIGNQFDLKTLAIVCQQSEGDTASSLWKALQEGFILPQTEVYKFYLSRDDASENTQTNENVQYRFLHDRVQQAAYSLIPENQKQTTHYHIGKLLLEKIPPEAREEIIFELVAQFNYGKNLIVKLEERNQLVQLNLIACRRAKASAAYNAALEYCNIALDYLETESWQNQYHLTRDLHLLGIELEYLNSNFERSRERAEYTLKYTQDVLDNVAIYQLKVQSYIVQSQMLAAIETGMKGLELLGFCLLDVPDIDVVNLELPELEAVGKLRELDDFTELAKIKFLATLIAPVYVAKPELFSKVIFAMVQSSIDYGYSSISAVGYGWYALLVLIAGYIDKAYHAGQISLRLLERFPSRENECKVLFIFYNFIGSLKNHLKESLAGLLQGARSGFDAGDVEYAAYCEMAYGTFLFSMGHNLMETKELQQPHYDLVKKLNLEFSTNFLGIWRQIGLNLLGESLDVTLLIGESFDEEDKLPKFQKTNSFTLLFSIHLNKAMLFYLSGNYSDSLEQCNLALNYIHAEQGVTHLSLHKLYYSLSLLANYLNIFDEINVLEIVDSNQQNLENWATHAPINFQHKYDLVEAEKCRVLRQTTEAIELYDKAIAGAKENQYIQEEALANELAAKFYLDWGKEKIAATYMQEAYYCYARWGAKAKTDDLEKRYPNLLHPILQQAAQCFNPLDTLTTIAQPNLSIHASQTTTQSSYTTINSALDFATVLKASQALSGIIELDELLRQLTQIILQHSGGDRCALVLRDSKEEWHVQAIATFEETQICSQPLENNPNLPTKLIQYVKKTQEVVVIHDLKTDLPVIDRYLLSRQPKSLLCLPIINQGHFIGILYLKNLSTSGAFTKERILVLNFLCTQAAISLENARLYKKAQEYAQQLEQSQLQVVQSEKMASLGNLVAGVAHEINNPIGFLNGSISNAKDYVQDLFEYLQTYHQQQPPNPEVEKLAENIDLEYLLEDLPKLLDAMKGATDRITNISTSLRTFSRADTDYKVSSNIHEGLDSTLLILKYRLKANNCRPAIQVTKDYGNLPTIKCFPGQLNQVFMNILANAIDIFDEMAQTQSYHEIEANPQQITIRTQIESNQVYIRIRDNGKGMSKDVQAKIFDHLFTTKEVGKGTGLGLAIARQIVVEKHGGNLNVWSEPGQGTEFVVQMSV